MNPYIGHDTQFFGVEELRLVGGKGDGMRLLEVNNGKGLELVISADRGADITRLKFKGINMSYISPCGYVAPAYFDSVDNHWLKSFTAGFLTTCGLENVGSPNKDEGEELSLHGSIANQPCDQIYWTEDADSLTVHALIRDEGIFARKLRLERIIKVSKEANEFEICDRITNTGHKTEPIEILYHMNMGYPLLDEDSVITVPAEKVLPRDEHAAGDIENWMKVQKPTPGYQERCYYHQFKEKAGMASIYQPKLHTELSIHFDTDELDAFVQWKMMGVRDYVMGLECGNCYPEGRKAMRESGMLKFLEAGATKEYCVKVKLTEK